MKDFVILIIIAVIITLATHYIIRAKKSGQKCIGCPYAKECGGKCSTEKPE